MKTSVVNIKTEPYGVYIGRGNTAKGLKKSPYANPFVIDKYSKREETIGKYREWFLSQPELVEQARKELKGKILGCWC